jgi:hypothetical protein
MNATASLWHKRGCFLNLKELTKLVKKEESDRLEFKKKQPVSVQLRQKRSARCLIVQVVL